MSTIKVESHFSGSIISAEIPLITSEVERYHIAGGCCALCLLIAVEHDEAYARRLWWGIDNGVQSDQVAVCAAG